MEDTTLLQGQADINVEKPKTSPIITNGLPVFPKNLTNVYSDLVSERLEINLLPDLTYKIVNLPLPIFLLTMKFACPGVTTIILL